MKLIEVLHLALRALQEAGPNAGGMSAAAGQQLRDDAIAALQKKADAMKGGTVQICTATAEDAASQADTPGADAPCTDAELVAWLEAHPGIELTSLATSASSRDDEPFSVVNITQTGPGGAISRIELLATGSTRRGALCAAVNRARLAAVAAPSGQQAGDAP